MVDETSEDSQGTLDYTFFLNETKPFNTTINFTVVGTAEYEENYSVSGYETFVGYEGTIVIDSDTIINFINKTNYR